MLGRPRETLSGTILSTFADAKTQAQLAEFYTQVGNLDGAITIPCPGPVESLNAAVATSVLLYEAARQRAAKSGGPMQRRGGTR